MCVLSLFKNLINTNFDKGLLKTAILTQMPSWFYWLKYALASFIFMCSCLGTVPLVTKLMCFFIRFSFFVGMTYRGVSQCYLVCGMFICISSQICGQWVDQKENIFTFLIISVIQNSTSRNIEWLWLRKRRCFGI